MRQISRRLLLKFSTLVIFSVQGESPEVDATIRWTQYGVPHIKASNYYSLGYGAGFAFARDNLCYLADQILKVKGERSLYFGPGKENENLKSDTFYRALNFRTQAESIFFKQSQDAQDIIKGYARGYNKQLALQKKEKSFSSQCADGQGLKEIDEFDLQAFYSSIAQLMGVEILQKQIIQASPPEQNLAQPSFINGKKALLPFPNLKNLEFGSNGWSFGKEKTKNGRGLLLGNPHYPAIGALKFYQMHLTIPGEYNVNGATLYGYPLVLIGFNENLAWTHTVASSRHFTVYKLKLKRDDPLSYRYDKQYKKIQENKFTVPVLSEDGSVKSVPRSIFFSHYGPILEAKDLAEWTEKSAYTIRDANEGIYQMIDQWLEMGRSKNFTQFKKVLQTHRGNPWANTLYADKEGNTYYADVSTVPKLSKSTLFHWRTNIMAQIVWNLAGVHLLDGSKSRDEWIGLISGEEAPQLHRYDYVSNHNDSPWLTNLNDKSRYFSPLYGKRVTAQSMRTRMGLKMLEELFAEKDVSPEGVKRKLFSQRSFLAELVKDDLVERCSSVKNWKRYLKEGIEPQDLKEACSQLKNWNGRYEVDEKGVAIFNEWALLMGGKSKYFRKKFRRSNPIGRPAKLKAKSLLKKDDLLDFFAEAVKNVNATEQGLGANWGELHYLSKGQSRWPIGGGPTVAGVFNMFSADLSLMGPRVRFDTDLPSHEKVISEKSYLSDQGYVIATGSSFIFLVDWDKNGRPNAEGILSYSQSSDSRSPHFDDQTELFAQKKLRPILFFEEDIIADPELKIDHLNEK